MKMNEPGRQKYKRRKAKCFLSVREAFKALSNNLR